MNCLYTVCEQPHACSDDRCNRIVNNIHKNMEEGLELLDPTELYNMLQQATIFSNLTDPNYLLLMGKYLEFIYFIMNYCIVFCIMLKRDGTNNNGPDWDSNSGPLNA